MARINAQSPEAVQAKKLVESLQRRFVDKLEAVARANGDDKAFEPIEWLRDEGRHGGGIRYCTGDTSVFNRGSVNVSQVHYDDDPNKRLGSATALSTIIHPRNPNAPSVHMHFSWTQMRDGRGYWRMMADLNPSIEERADKATFEAALRNAAGDQFEPGSAQGDRYFNIPALQRHRGVSHFYLEGYSTKNKAADANFARSLAESMIDCYADLLRDALDKHPEATDDDRARQLAYHSLYLLQVLTLDRGTTSGLLIHADNDVGTLGSLPSHVDRELLASWKDRMPAPQDQLLAAIVDALPNASPSPVTTAAKQALANIVRDHYRAHPRALDLQASGDIIPPTVNNHA